MHRVTHQKPDLEMNYRQPALELSGLWTRRRKAAGASGGTANQAAARRTTPISVYFSARDWVPTRPLGQRPRDPGPGKLSANTSRSAPASGARLGVGFLIAGSHSALRAGYQAVSSRSGGCRISSVVGCSCPTLRYFKTCRWNSARRVSLEIFDTGFCGPKKMACEGRSAVSGGWK